MSCSYFNKFSACPLLGFRVSWDYLISIGRLTGDEYIEL